MFTNKNVQCCHYLVSQRLLNGNNKNIEISCWHYTKTENEEVYYFNKRYMIMHSERCDSCKVKNFGQKMHLLQINKTTGGIIDVSIWRRINVGSREIKTTENKLCLIMFFLHQNKVCTVKVQFDHTCKSKGMTLLEVHFVSMLLLFLEIFFRFLPS